MNIAVLNGNPDPSENDFNNWLDRFYLTCKSKGHQLNGFTLATMHLKSCVGCWDCWLKTPGTCSHHDDTGVLRRAILKSDLTIWASPLIMGFTSSLLKLAQDKMIPMISPYFRNVKGEIHHRLRYSRYPKFGLLMAGETTSTSEDIEITVNLFRRFATNFSTALVLSTTNDKQPEEVCREIGML